MQLTETEAALLRQELAFIALLTGKWPHFRVLSQLLRSVPDTFGLRLNKQVHAKYALVLKGWAEGERLASKAHDSVSRNDTAGTADADFESSANNFRQAQQNLAAVAQILDPLNERPLVPAFTGFFLVHRFLLQMPSQFQLTGWAYCGLCFRCISDTDLQLFIAASHLCPASVQQHFIPVLKLPSDRKKQREEGYMDLLYIPPTGKGGLTSTGDFGLLCKLKQGASPAQNCEDQIAAGGEKQFANIMRQLKAQACKQAVQALTGQQMFRHALANAHLMDPLNSAVRDQMIKLVQYLTGKNSAGLRPMYMLIPPFKPLQSPQKTHVVSSKPTEQGDQHESESSSLNGHEGSGPNLTAQGAASGSQDTTSCGSIKIGKGESRLNREFYVPQAHFVQGKGVGGHDQTGMLVSLGLAHFYWPLSDECQEFLDQQQRQQQQKLQQDMQAKKKQRHQGKKAEAQGLLQPQAMATAMAMAPVQAQQPTSSGETSQDKPLFDHLPAEVLPVVQQTMQATACIAAQARPPGGPAYEMLFVVPDAAVAEPNNIAAFQKIQPGKAVNIVYNSTEADVPVWYLSLQAMLAEEAQRRLEHNPDLRATHEKCATARLKKEQEEFSPLPDPDANKLFLFGKLLRQWDLK